jgi:septal ring factor EnvC (AmiA/AmiB activator)
MLKLNRRFIALVAVLAFSASTFLVGCTSRPSEDELRQLNDLKAEVASLEKQIADKEKEKANLENEVAEKNAKLQQCQSDMDAVKNALGQ